MASLSNPAYKYKTDLIGSRAMSFKRQKRKTRRKRVRKRIKLKYAQIVLFFLLLGGMFYLIQQSYLFLIQWEKLRIKEVNITCQRLETKKDILDLLRGKDLGNIFLCDINHLQRVLSTHTWVREVQISKSYPSSLKIELKERIPIALIQKEHLYLADRDGICLEKVESAEGLNLPVFVDDGIFKENYEEKISKGMEFLEALLEEERRSISFVVLSDPSNIKVKLKGSNPVLFMGRGEFSDKFSQYKRYKTYLQDNFGPLDYIDLRFQDRFYIRPHNSASKNKPINLDWR